jgi:hypothetical protein
MRLYGRGAGIQAIDCSAPNTCSSPKEYGTIRRTIFTAHHLTDDAER